MAGAHSRVARRFVRGCTRSRRTLASTIFGEAGVERSRISCKCGRDRCRRVSGRRLAPAVPRQAPRRGRSRRPDAREGDAVTRIPRCDTDPHAPPTRRSAACAKCWDGQVPRSQRCSTAPSRPSTAHCNEPAPLCSATRHTTATIGPRDHRPRREDRLVERYIAAHEAADADMLVQLLAEAARFTMPPRAVWFEGRDAVAAEFRRGWGDDRTDIGGSCRPEPTCSQPRAPISERGTTTPIEASASSYWQHQTTRSRKSPCSPSHSCSLHSDCASTLP